MTETIATDSDYTYYNGYIVPQPTSDGENQLPNSTVYDNIYYNGETVPQYSQPTIVNTASMSEEEPE